jgi:hypothetical protein
MREWERWLLHDDQRELFDYLYANVQNAVFLALVALLLWPLGRATMALRLAKGYWVFWIVLLMTGAALIQFRRIFRVDLESRYDAYVISALVVSGFLQAGWSAFAAVTVRDFAAAAPVWIAVVLYTVGLLSCWVAYGVVSALYMGSIYRLFNLPLAAGSFVLFGVWPAAGRALYGWFFDLF